MLCYAMLCYAILYSYNVICRWAPARSRGEGRPAGQMGGPRVPRLVRTKAILSGEAVRLRVFLLELLCFNNIQVCFI